MGIEPAWFWSSNLSLWRGNSVCVRTIGLWWSKWESAGVWAISLWADGCQPACIWAIFFWAIQSICWSESFLAAEHTASECGIRWECFRRGPHHFRELHGQDKEQPWGV